MRDFPEKDNLLWDATGETLTSIWVLTTLNWVYNANEDDLLENKKVNQRNLNFSSPTTLKKSSSLFVGTGQGLKECYLGNGVEQGSTNFFV